MQLEDRALSGLMNDWSSVPAGWMAVGGVNVGGAPSLHSLTDRDNWLQGLSGPQTQHWSNNTLLLVTSTPWPICKGCHLL